MHRFRAVLFDWGGTLTTLNVPMDLLISECLRGVQTYLKGKGIQASLDRLRELDLRTLEQKRMTEDFKEVNVTEAFTLFLRNLGLDAAKAVELVGEVIRADYMTVVPYYVLLPEALPTLQALKRCGYRMGVVSNNAFSEMLRATVKALGLSSFFGAVVASGDVGVKKPGPPVFLRALDLLDCRAEETVFVGDSLEADVAGARALGMTTIWVNPSGSNVDIDPGPSYEVRSLREILSILRHVG